MASHTIDKRDKRILELLDKLGAKTSTRQLQKELVRDKSLKKISDRTVRYRLENMRKAGILKTPRVQTHERRIGLGEQLMILEEIPQNGDTLSGLVKAMPCYWNYAPTVGKYNGYLVHSMYPLVTPQMNKQIADEMVRGKLVSSYEIYDIVDYERKRPNLSCYHPTEGWIWDWERWYSIIQRSLKSDRKNPISVDSRPALSDFDFNDVQIIKELIHNPEATMKEIAANFDLSESQVNKRIKKLEREGVIKGYRPIYDLGDDPTEIWIFMRLGDKASSIIYSFYQLPFALGFSVESSTRISMRVYLPGKYVNEFIKGFNIMRDEIPFYAFQFGYEVVKKEHEPFFDIFNPETKTWDFPAESYTELVRDFATRV